MCDYNFHLLPYVMSSHLCHCPILFSFKGVSVTFMPPSACCRMGTSSASVNTTPLARTASAAGRASKPSPGRLVPTCQHPMEPPTPVRTQNMFLSSHCVEPTHQSDTQLDTILLTPFTSLRYGCLSAYFTVLCMKMTINWSKLQHFNMLQYKTAERGCVPRGAWVLRHCCKFDDLFYI